MVIYCIYIYCIMVIYCIYGDEMMRLEHPGNAVKFRKRTSCSHTIQQRGECCSLWVLFTVSAVHYECGAQWRTMWKHTVLSPTTYYRTTDHSYPPYNVLPYYWPSIPPIQRTTVLLGIHTPHTTYYRTTGNSQFLLREIKFSTSFPPSHQNFLYNIIHSPSTSYSNPHIAWHTIHTAATDSLTHWLT